jgi:hypothetical protein
LQYAPTSNLIITADALYSDFNIETNATSYGHWFTAPNVENAVVDENGTVVDMYQEIGLATDFHAKKFDRLTETSSLGLNFDWHVNNHLNMQIDIDQIVFRVNFFVILDIKFEGLSDKNIKPFELL